MGARSAVGHPSGVEGIAPVPGHPHVRRDCDDDSSTRRFHTARRPELLHRGQRAYLGKGLWSRRLTEPAMQPDELPALDAIVLSHLHGDHFDRISRRETQRSQAVFTTPPAARRLRSWGFEAEGLDTWGRRVLNKGEETLSIEAVPAVHARVLMGVLLPPVMGSVLEHRVDEVRRRIYISGDTLTGDHVSEIAVRHPYLDLAVVHLGGTRVLLDTVTMDAEQGVDLLQRVHPRQAMPVHYDDYGVFRSPLAAFERSAADAGLGSLVRRVERGQIVPLDPAEPS
jgi:L-ascorbate metabolism protein UlaG (beta-lactamase superfamily)